MKPTSRTTPVIALLVMGAAYAHAATVTCSSKPGGRTVCPADSSGGVALSTSTGTAVCLLGKTWGYDDVGVWVSDGCGRATSTSWA